MMVGRQDDSLNVTVNVVVLPSVSEHDAGTAAFGCGGVLSTTMGTTSAPLYPSSVEGAVLAGERVAQEIEAALTEEDERRARGEGEAKGSGANRADEL